MAAWGGANVVAGSALIGASVPADSPELFGAGAQAASWGLINLGIAGVGALTDPGPAQGLAGSLEAEHGFSEVLFINTGLDVGYALVGVTLVTLGLLGAPYGRDLVGHGAGIAVQGAGLFVLDLWAWLESQERERALLNEVQARAP